MTLLKSASGTTLVDMLIGAVIGVIATAAAVELYIHQHNNWMMQEGVSESQQNGRAAIEEMASKIRMAGYGVPEGLEPIMSSTAPGTHRPDTIAVVYLHEPVCTASVDVAMSQQYADLDCSGDISCFETGGWCYIWDPNSKSGEFFPITLVNESNGRIQHAGTPLSKCYPSGSQLLTFDMVRYFIDDRTDSLHPVLVRHEFNDQPQIYADNIVDLQVQYRMTDGSVSDKVTEARYIRRVDIAVVARTKNEDPLLGDYRYDTLRTSVQVRNLAFQ